MKHFYSLALLSLLSLTTKAQLVINEFSQGHTGNKEYIELVVVGNRTCLDSTADLRKWIVDDNTKEWFGSGGNAAGFVRFKNIPEWSAIPYGSIILLYNSNDKNAMITMANDPTDANNDGVYIVPINSSLLENTTSNNYTNTSFSNNSTNSWDRLSLRNAGDAVFTIHPNNLNSAYHSVAFGSNANANAAQINVPNSGGSEKVIYLNDANYTNSTSWLVGVASNNTATSDETPGAPNSPANAAWINSMKVPANINGILVRDTVQLCASALPFQWKGQTVQNFGDSVATFDKGACDTTFALYLRPMQADTVIINQTICNTQLPFIWNNQRVTAVGSYTLYHTAVSNVTRCDSISILNLQVNASQQINITQTICQENLPFVWNGQSVNTAGMHNLNYTSLGINGCDSVTNLNLTVLSQATSNMSANLCADQLPFVFNNNNYYTAGTYNVVFKNINGCDSIVLLTLNIAPAATTNLVELSGCDSVQYNNKWYKNSVILSDTVKNGNGCDSIYNNVNIKVTNGFYQLDTVQICAVDGYDFHGTTLNRSGYYTKVYSSNTGCDSIYAVQLIARERPELFIELDPLARTCAGDTLFISFAGADSLVWNPKPDYLFHSRAGYVIQEGENVFTLNGSNGGNCINKKSVVIHGENCCEIGIPNAFTPNGDGLNDYFQIITPGNPSYFSLMIYDRYGAKVFMSNKSTVYWDGTYNGELVNMGVYYYILETECNGKNQIRKGDITVIR